MKLGLDLVYELIEKGVVLKVGHLKSFLKFENLIYRYSNTFPVFKKVLKHIPDGKRIVKEQFPDILVQCFRYMEKSDILDLALVNDLLDYGINACTSPEEGSIFHWLAFF